MKKLLFVIVALLVAGCAGPQGPIGPVGPAGPEGPEGPQGFIGPAGPQGDRGPQGFIGPAGTAPEPREIDVIVLPDGAPAKPGAFFSQGWIMEGQFHYKVQVLGSPNKADVYYVIPLLEPGELHELAFQATGICTVKSKEKDMLAIGFAEWKQITGMFGVRCMVVKDGRERPVGRSVPWTASRNDEYRGSIVVP